MGTNVISHASTWGRGRLRHRMNVTGLEVNDQLVTCATRFSAVHLKNHGWSHHRALKATSLVLTHLTIQTTAIDKYKY